MRSQGSKVRGTAFGAAIAVTLLCWSSCLAPARAQSSKTDSGSATLPPSASLSGSQKDEIKPIASQAPRITLDFHFDAALSDDAVGSTPQIAALAKALASQDLKGSTFVIACHEMATGRPEADQDRAVRCAETVKRVLVEKFGLAAEALIAVGFGSSKPRNPADPGSTENQRVEILNMGETRSAVSR
jgi:outer membrane protein OmpA-like peptidoglycan-associated protein